MGLDQAIAEDAAILTGIGIGTAFAVLLLLLVLTVLVRQMSVMMGGRVPKPTDDAQARPTEDSTEARNRALAAAVAVTALLAANPRSAGPSGERSRDTR